MGQIPPPREETIGQGIAKQVFLKKTVEKNIHDIKTNQQ
jgi:hypothetical protein